MCSPIQSCSQNLPWSDALPVQEDVVVRDLWPAPDCSDNEDVVGAVPTDDAPRHRERPGDLASRVPSTLRATEDELVLLLDRVMRQDDAALSELYARMSGRVYAVALRFTRRVDLAEEVLQDTFWQIWRQAPRFDPVRGTAAAWIMTMARSRAMDALRALHRTQSRTSFASSDETIETSGDHAPDPSDLLGEVQRDSLLHRAVSALDPLKRQLVGLAFYRGLTHEEIASQTGLPLGTVKSHLRRTLTVLKQALGADNAIENRGQTA